MTTLTVSGTKIFSSPLSANFISVLKDVDTTGPVDYVMLSGFAEHRVTLSSDQVGRCV